ncbi:hypothetical protein JL721_4424 [Aureococcus anophagefferens]|nr:hypothetical protein JL721_4424 [Aureococcus anophagefferens]
MGAPPAGYPCPPWELSERPVDHAGQVHDHYPARGAPVSYRLKDRAPALHESMAYVAALGGDGASPALLYRGDEPASPPRDPAADDTARGDLELSLVFESDAAMRMVSSSRRGRGRGREPARRRRRRGRAGGVDARRAATLNVYEVVIDQDGALGLGLRRRRARRGRSSSASPGQSDAAGIVVGSRLVGVNGDGVSNRPASSDNDPYRLLGVAKDADESAIRKAYKKTSLKTHPDRGGRKSLFVAVNKACAVLADEQTRRDYDTCADSVDFDKAMTLIKNSPRPLTLQLVRPVEKEPEDEEDERVDVSPAASGLRRLQRHRCETSAC